MNLKELFEEIQDNIKLNNNTNIKHLNKIIQKYNSNDWLQYRKANEDTYGKIFVNGNEEFDIYIITWNNHQESKIHNHSDNGCIYKILEGHLIEEAFDR